MESRVDLSGPDSGFLLRLPSIENKNNPIKGAKKDASRFARGTISPAAGNKRKIKRFWRFGKVLQRVAPRIRRARRKSNSENEPNDHDDEQESHQLPALQQRKLGRDSKQAFRNHREPQFARKASSGKFQFDHVLDSERAHVECDSIAPGPSDFAVGARGETVYRRN